MSKLTQEQQVLQLLRKAGGKGVANYEWPQHRIQRASARLSELKADGHHIICERDYLPNGRATNVFRHILIEVEEKKKPWWKR